MYMVNCDCTDCGNERLIGPCLLEVNHANLDKKFIEEMMKKREKNFEEVKETKLRQRRNSIDIVTIV
jgi:hypothetical protein